MGRARIIPANPSAIFLPFQSRWVEDNKRIKMARKGRQLGFSWATAYAANKRTALRGARYDQWVSSRDDIQARLFPEACKLWAQRSVERSGGKESANTGRSRWSPTH